MSPYKPTHTQDCDCSVCWCRRHSPSLAPSQSTPCGQCRPVSAEKVGGVWKVTPAFLCAKHTPSLRPPQYWRECFTTGKPTPFVPIHEPFTLEG
ncbi:DUF5447 family protein [Pseudomonas sp. J452]|uniref:DUF5447 family protein n=1 Tax=Pseudomonas sp. J452 TaxID=2898441 RepID=UPI0021ADD83E|nr:DUF5447 family protein [Pseudomonas sp. J452]UUY10479.1 DUF5447 family protein [Pseudomonas sp. J452]